MDELTAPAPTRAGGPAAPDSATSVSQAPEPASTVPRGANRRSRMYRVRRWYNVLARALQRAALSAGAHGCFNLAQSTAYSAFLALLPALGVAAAVIGLLPDTAPVRFQLAAFFHRVLPSNVSPLLDAIFDNSPVHAHSVRTLIVAGFVSFLGAANVISTLMEGLRRARDLPTSAWSFWQRRRRTFELVPLSLVPLAVASILIVFGHAVTQLLVSSIGPESQSPIYMIAVLVRWAICFGASVGLIGLVYHLGVPDADFPIQLPASMAGGIHVPIPGRIATAGRRSRAMLRAASRTTIGSIGSTLMTPSFAGAPEGRMPVALPPRRWHTVLPGAIMATAMWFLTTLAFGWYVTRFANYSEYGSIGAAVALLLWLYIISLSVLCGAEFNAQFDHLAAIHFASRHPATTHDATSSVEATAQSGASLPAVESPERGASV